ncbi:DUF389 domain-containing protein [Brachybacterium saurashtrense]|uniref:DUF389 domain-containing protein n=1 Tax=Brachybacterium saurashtrense TaxID=556288 RepID=UPI0019CF7262|nr:DUF389 domain-containing protein [Brachybacterium saurashtrense]
MARTRVPDLARAAAMRDAVLFEGPDRGRRLSRFWILLVLSSVIAAAGVIGDSTATVIGAMIVAPMMLPIQGAMISTVLGDRTQLIRCAALVLTAALTVVAIGYLLALTVAVDIVAATNSQVSGRVHPRLIDLVAALGTGVVGSIALIRRDISDTLPGVAIAISLVPPLSVVGITLEAHAYGEALGALLLFITNVAAILATGIALMTACGFHRIASESRGPEGGGVSQRRAALVVAGMLLLVGIPLSASTVDTSARALRESTVNDIASEWLEGTEWQVLEVSSDLDATTLRVSGPEPAPDTGTLRNALQQAGVDIRGIEVELVPSNTVLLESP